MIYMKLKKAYLPVIIMIVAALVIGGCGKKPETSAEQPNQSQESQGSQSDQGSQAAKSWTSPPEMIIDTAKTYEAEVKTSKGSFKIHLFAKDAPKTVNNFVFLSQEGFYNGVTFHRIIESFMIQTGDPTGTGAGGPGYKFEDETTNYQYEPGIIAMANAGPNTNGSQFFICTGEDSVGLNQMPNYTIFGKVTEGMDIIKHIAATPVETNRQTGETSKPSETVTIDSIKIKEQ